MTLETAFTAETHRRRVARRIFFFNSVSVSHLCVSAPLRLIQSLAVLLIHLALPAWSLDWQSFPGHRVALVSVADGGAAGFTMLSATNTGITFTNAIPYPRWSTNQVLLNGSGVAAGDVDGDGWCDVFFCGLDRPSALYRNLGNWKFADHTEASGLNLSGVSATGAAFADLDGDGDLDLVVNSVGQGTHVLQNDGRGHFKRHSLLNVGKGGMSLALGDLDGDGLLDLYVANYRTAALMDMPNAFFSFANVGGKRVISRVNGRSLTEPDLANRFRINARGGIEEVGELDALFFNRGSNGFVRASFTDGTFLDEDGRPLTAPPFEWGLSVMIRDLNGDGRPDIYVCNDFDEPDRFWLNQGDGKFRAAPRLTLRKSSFFSMGMDVADSNRDGFDDLFVLDMLSRDHVMRMDFQGDREPPVSVIGQFDNRPEYMMNTLFLNRGDGTYAEMAQFAGLAAAEWAWAAAFLDVDLDGYEDLLITNGNERQSRSLDAAARLKAMRTERKMTAEEIFEARKIFPRYASPNLAFRNRGDLTFAETGKDWGFDFNGVSHGMALADLDNDGDFDVLVNNLNDRAGVFRNNTSAPRLAVRLKGKHPNRQGIGANIVVLGGAVPRQSQQMICGGRYLSGDDAMRVFAAGSLTNEMTIEVTWPGGKRSVATAVKGNCVYEIDEVASQLVSATTNTVRRPHFTDVSALLAHQHHDDPFDDFARQPLLPKQLSQSGPGVSWIDLDGDGWEDLVIGSGKGGSMAAFKNDGHGGFQRLTGAPFDQVVSRDQTTILPWRKGAGGLVLLAGSANYEDGLTNGAVAREFHLTTRTVEESLPGQSASTGPMAMADVDGDGQLDLFVGGSVPAGRWPEAASSLLFRGGGGKFLPDVENTKLLTSVGLVNGAVFSDLDGDGDVELVLACDWGTLRVFRNEGGKLVDSTEAFGLGELRGCWNGIASADFNGDGQMDLLATGWGSNTRHQPQPGQPLELFHADFNNDGTVEVMEAFYDPALHKLVPQRGLDFLAKAMPFLREKFPTHQAFGRASVEELLGERRSSARRLSINELRSMVFLNIGGKFTAHPLPAEAQLAPAFGVGVGDFDGDGFEDVFLAQNFFAVQPETPRYDGGCGLWLRGDGRGGFKAVSVVESGINLPGEQRGMALADFDHDGRLDLVVAQNGGPTKLFRNQAAKPGLRVRLIGPVGNPDAVGAVVRLASDGKPGAAREVCAGSGWWSVEAPVRVMTGGQGSRSLRVRWPGGQDTTAQVPPGVTEITLGVSGVVKTTP